MGSSGSKRTRKGEPRQHLPKVGAHDAAREEQHLERSAIADTMGLGAMPGWVKWVGLFIGALILIGGVVSLVAIN
jgi:hypothetical protein